MLRLSAKGVRVPGHGRSSPRSAARVPSPPSTPPSFLIRGAASRTAFESYCVLILVVDCMLMWTSTRPGQNPSSTLAHRRRILKGRSVTLAS